MAEPMSDITAPTKKRYSAHFGTLLALGFKLLKSAKLVKAALLGASAASYAWLFSWEFAFVILFALAVHEWGHVKAMNWMGMPTKGMYFIPFIGAVAVGDLSRSRFEEAFVALMGPAFGALSLIPLAFLGWADGDPRWFAYVGMVALVNLFNLLPIAILDGGRVMVSITSSIGPRVGMLAFAVGILLGAAVTWTMGSYVLAVIMALSIPEFFSERRRHRALPIPPMPPKEIAATTAVYLGLFLLFLTAISLVSGIAGADLAHQIVSG